MKINIQKIFTAALILFVVILSSYVPAFAASDVTVTQQVSSDKVILRTSLEASEPIGRVDFQRNGTIFASDTTPDNEGNYEAEIGVQDGQQQAVTVIAFGRSGLELARREVKVDFRAGNQAKSDPASILDKLRQFAKDTPVPVARSFPYILFGALALLALWLSRQAAREVVYVRKLTRLLRKEKLLAEEKTSFLALSSHYLNTPLTLMRNGLELLTSLNKVPIERAAALQELIDQLASDVKQLNLDTRNNTALTGIVEPDIAKAQKKARISASPFVLWPLVIVVGLVVLGNYLFGVVGQLPLDTVNLITQAVLICVVGGMLYVAERSRRLHKQEQRTAHILLDHQRSIDAARNAFIQHARGVLAGGLGKISKSAQNIGDSKETEYFWRGYKVFEDMLAKFELLGSLENGQPLEIAETILPADLINQIWQERSEKIANNKLQLQIEGAGLAINQNRRLLTFAIDSVMDNAIKFSRPESIVKATISDKKNLLGIVIENQGDAVPEDQLAHLFQPFSRTESVMTFNYEGLGFSLFLDRIILGYLGGTISANSVPGKKLTIKMEVPAL